MAAGHKPGAAAIAPTSRLRLRFSLWHNRLPVDALPVEGWIELQLLSEGELERECNRGTALLANANRTPEACASGVTVLRLLYCPALATAVVIASGRFSSSVSSVPAGSVAERCLLSQ